MNATDRDSGLNGELRFELTPTSGVFGGVGASDYEEGGGTFALTSTKNVASLILMRPLDYERTREYHFIVTARDISGAHDTSTVYGTRIALLIQ